MEIITNKLPTPVRTLDSEVEDGQRLSVYAGNMIRSWTKADARQHGVGSTINPRDYE